MRRSEKAVTDPGELYRIIDSCEFCRIGMINSGIPYIVPVCFVRSGHGLFFHSAQEGLKNDLLRKNPTVCFEMEWNVAMIRSDNPCRWGVRYESIIGTGHTVFVDDSMEKEQVLAAMMRKYGSNGETYLFEKAAIDATCIIRIDILSLTGKRS